MSGSFASWRSAAIDCADAEAGFDWTIGAGLSYGVGSTICTVAISAFSDCAVGRADCSAGNGRSCQAIPTANTKDAASEVGAIQRAPGLVLGRVGLARRAAACAAARMLASRSGPGAVRPCKRGNDLANARSSASSGLDDCGGCGGRRVMPAALHAVCPLHSAGATSRSRGRRR